MAGNVQQLAEQSKVASNSIQELVPKIMAKLEGDMQKNSITMTEQIVERNDKTRPYSEQVRDMALSLDELFCKGKKYCRGIVDLVSCIHITLSALL
ncbi:MAG: hypothetical protein K2J72_04980 [Oscillospiraceae bacterium]|nr:hypothetical protein [Oscillospiraceae bacterium]